jgi:hypothetical protein
MFKNSGEYVFVQLSKTRKTILFSSYQSPPPFLSFSPSLQLMFEAFGAPLACYTRFTFHIRTLRFSLGQPFLLTNSNQYWTMPLKIKTGAGVLEWLHVDKHCTATGVLQSSVKRAKNINELKT